MSFAIPGLERLITRIPQHVGSMPPEAASPLTHFWDGLRGAHNTVNYFERLTRESSVERDVYDRHMARLRGMALIGMIQSFERYAKEAAAVCVDQIVPLVLEDRIAEMKFTTSAVAANFTEGTLGRAVCESLVWLSTKEIQERFKKLLAAFDSNDPFEFFSPFEDPKPSRPASSANARGFQAPYRAKPPTRRRTMDILIQLRHAITHNVGVLTASDGAKLRILTKEAIPSPSILLPTRADVWYVRTFLEETVNEVNGRIAARLAEVLTEIHARDPGLVDPGSKAGELARIFNETVTVAGATRTP